MNPGPTHHDQDTQGKSNKETTASTEENVSVQSDVTREILQAIKQQTDQQTALIRGDLGVIKSELDIVKHQCEEINTRCDKMEKDYQKLTATVGDSVSDIQHLHSEMVEGRKETTGLTTSVESMKQEISQLKSEIDKLEEYSRRENLRMFGIPHRGQNEDNDTCVSAVLDTLNGIERGTKTWTADDIVRAHRIGQSREGNPRPMIVRFVRWRDKMEIINNKDLRGKLKEKGVKVSNDLTRTQANIVTQARKEGKVAYFSRGRMVIGPLPPDPRTYAQVASKGVTNSPPVADDSRTTTPEATREGSQGRRETSNRSEGSPPRDVSGTSDSPRQLRGLADRRVNLQRDDVGVSPSQHRRGVNKPAGTRGATRCDDTELSGSARTANTGPPTSRQAGLHGYFRNQTNKPPAVDSGSDRTLRDRKI